jgi:formylmethanofuran dehydrogenase subunit A
MVELFLIVGLVATIAGISYLSADKISRLEYEKMGKEIRQLRKTYIHDGKVVGTDTVLEERCGKSDYWFEVEPSHRVIEVQDMDMFKKDKRYYG